MAWVGIVDGRILPVVWFQRSASNSTYRVIILNRGSMFAFDWREFSSPLSSAHRFLQCYHRQKRDRRRCNSRRIPPQPPASMVISQWARSLEWRHVVTLHNLVGKICITFFLFYCEGMLSLVVLWLCDSTVYLEKFFRNTVWQSVKILETRVNISSSKMAPAAT